MNLSNRSPLFPAAHRLDQARLDEHFQQCGAALGPWHRCQCLVEAVDGFLAPRLVTTLVLLSLPVLLGTLLPF